MGKVSNSPGRSYAEIAESLFAEIREGRYSARNPFPSLTQIMRRFGVTRVTAMRSVDALKKRGVLSAEPRSRLNVKTPNRTIGLIVPGIAVTDFFKPIVSEINRLAHEHGYALRFGEVWSDVFLPSNLVVRESTGMGSPGAKKRKATRYGKKR